jgi:hypothetical protein
MEAGSFTSESVQFAHFLLKNEAADGSALFTRKVPAISAAIIGQRCSSPKNEG